MTNDRFMQIYEDLKKQKIGANIQKRREQLGLSLNDAAAALGINSAELAAYEYGAEEIYLDMAFKICELLKADMDYFTRGLEKITVREVLNAAA